MSLPTPPQIDENGMMLEDVSTRTVGVIRGIHDKYRVALTGITCEKLEHVVSNGSSINLTTFLRTQYDALRRLRSYWVLRYLLHRY